MLGSCSGKLLIVIIVNCIYLLLFHVSKSLFTPGRDVGKK